MLPKVELEGSPFEQGLIHGQRARRLIEHNLRIYFEHFASGGLTRAEVLRRAEAYWDVLPGQNPDYAEALKGVAEGSGCDLIEIVALNLRYEILYHQFSENALATSGGCTSFAVLPKLTAERHLLMGQNWDWIPEVRGIVLHVREGGYESLSFTEAGIVGGKIGLNSFGLGLVINGLNSTDDDWSRLERPFHLRCYEVLRAQDLAEASEVITKDKRSCSANFLLAQVEAQAVDIEAAPLATHTLTPKDGFMAHTNHFIAAEALGVVEPPTEKLPHSQRRLERAVSLLSSREPLRLDDLKEYLRDHVGYPYSICRHIDELEPEGERYQTVVSVIIDLKEREFWISCGPPCENPYHRLKL